MEARAYTPADRDACVALLAARGADPVEWEAFLAGPEGGRFWVLEHEGAVLACGGLAARDGDCDELVYGVVEARLERQGLGRFLLLYRARQSRTARLEAEVPAAYLRFWEKNGFRVVGGTAERPRVARKMAVCP